MKLKKEIDHQGWAVCPCVATHKVLLLAPVQVSSMSSESTHPQETTEGQPSKNCHMCIGHVESRHLLLKWLIIIIFLPLCIVIRALLFRRLRMGLCLLGIYVLKERLTDMNNRNVLRLIYIFRSDNQSSNH